MCFENDCISTSFCPCYAIDSTLALVNAHLKKKKKKEEAKRQQQKKAADKASSFFFQEIKRRIFNIAAHLCTLPAAASTHLLVTVH